MKLATLAILAGFCATAVQAATPAELLAGYRAEAARQTTGFQPDAKRGAEFFARRFGISDKMPACASCHMDKPTQAGRHVVTDKTIKPLAPAANDQRFTELAKAEKWFGRNCKEVVGRECSPAEKADFVAFMMEVR
ncbi:hypothetical protein MASR1M60_27340 [Rhodocyclaceae bacterium]